MLHLIYEKFKTYMRQQQQNRNVYLPSFIKAVCMILSMPIIFT